MSAARVCLARDDADLVLHRQVVLFLGRFFDGVVQLFKVKAGLPLSPLLLLKPKYHRDMKYRFLTLINFGTRSLNAHFNTAFCESKVDLCSRKLLIHIINQ